MSMFNVLNIGQQEFTIPATATGINVALTVEGVKPADTQKISTIFFDLQVAAADGKIELDEGAQVLLDLVDMPPMKKAAFQNFISTLKADLADNRIDGSELPGLLIAGYMLFTGFRM